MNRLHLLRRRLLLVLACCAGFSLVAISDVEGECQCTSPLYCAEGVDCDSSCELVIPPNPNDPIIWGQLWAWGSCEGCSTCCSGPQTKWPNEIGCFKCKMGIMTSMCCPEDEFCAEDAYGYCCCETGIIGLSNCWL